MQFISTVLKPKLFILIEMFRKRFKKTYSQSTLRLNIHDSQNRFIKNSISYIFTSLRICGNLKSHKWAVH